MKSRIAIFVLAVMCFVPFTARAQSFNLRDLLTDFFREGITLQDPPAGSPFPSHAHHFIGDASIVPLEQLNNQLAIQLSTFPLASSAGGFTYQYDPTLGTFTRASDSFGPIYTERADTNGKGKFNVGLNFSHFTFDKIDDLSLRDGDVQIVFRHQDLPPAGCCLNPFFEGDVITTQTFLKIQTDITALTFSYGVTDQLDIGAAIPIVRVQIQAQTNATIDRLATGANPGTAEHPRVHERDGQRDVSESGSASGVGDIVLRAKYRLTPAGASERPSESKAGSDRGRTGSARHRNHSDQGLRDRLRAPGDVLSAFERGLHVVEQEGHHSRRNQLRGGLRLGAQSRG